ncbi:MAG: IS4 family transposase ISSysp2 (plasmid) [Chroococcopsis gigantea SAG 12.99]|nr:IS4 family transposase ISSysp2 [Chroococcopsis gigantea SAG 12.99]
MDLLDRFEEIFPDAEIAYLCGDREFIGQEWLTYLLLTPTIPFRLRIKSNHQIHDGRRKLKASVILPICKRSVRNFVGKALGLGRSVYVSALRLEDGELLIVISATKPRDAITDYARRWGIETLFGIFKTRGFCLESTHFQDSQRLSRLLALMSLALCWAVKQVNGCQPAVLSR